MNEKPENPYNQEPVIGSTSAMSVGELAVGQFVTVLKSVPRVREAMEGSMNGQTITQKITSQDRSYMGDILQVKAVALPYIVVEKLNGQIVGLPMQAFHLDTRLITFMELTKEYINALLERKK